MDIKIKTATLKDLKTIQQLNGELFDYEIENKFDYYIKDWATSKDSEEYFSDLIENQFVIIAETGNSPIAYLAGSVYNDNSLSYYEGLTAELNNMFVKEEYRKFGIGTKLVNSFLDWCKQNNAKRVFVTASAGNENTIKFYQKNGFYNINTTLRIDL